MGLLQLAIVTNEGWFINGKLDGMGREVNCNKDIFYGLWKNGYKVHGVKRYAEGGQYKGNWRFKERHGHGVMQYKDGSKYVGTWRNDKRWGHGIFTYPDGSKKEGQWECDEYLGPISTASFSHLPDSKIAVSNSYQNPWADKEL